MEKIKPRPTSIRVDFLSLEVKASLAQAFGTMGNQDEAKIYHEKACDVGRAILERVENYRDNYAQLDRELRKLKGTDQDRYKLVIGVLHEVQREKIPIKIPEPRKSMHEVFSRELV